MSYRTLASHGSAAPRGLTRRELGAGAAERRLRHRSGCDMSTFNQLLEHTAQLEGVLVRTAREGNVDGIREMDFTRRKWRRPSEN